MSRSLDYWRNLTRATVRGDDETIERVAQMAYELDARGKPASIRHAEALVAMMREHDTKAARKPLEK